MSCFTAIRNYLQERSRRREQQERERRIEAVAEEEANARRSIELMDPMTRYHQETSFKRMNKLTLQQRRSLDWEQYKRQAEFRKRSQEKSQERDKKKPLKGGAMHGNDLLDVYRDLKTAEMARRVSTFNEADYAIMYKMAAYYDEAKIKASLEVAESTDYAENAGFNMFYNEAVVWSLEPADVADDDGEDVGFGMFCR